MINNRIGSIIRNFRLSRTMTQEQLADKIGASSGYIGNIERGNINITIKTLNRIAEACETDFVDLIKIGSTEDEANAKILALLLTKEPSERRRALNVLVEMFRIDP
ncbi:helix-turn-helix domain-containing protein [Cohnella soli]|uniref:Helix-turn-helix domain-containing protein n=1 Tax=Cohnella soli TaxID=425005 RepID=A0ABW0HMV8_9BACL